MKYKQKTIYKAVTIILIAIFFFQNLGWAQPDIAHQQTSAHTLQIPSRFNPLGNIATLHDIVIQTEIASILKTEIPGDSLEDSTFGDFRARRAIISSQRGRTWELHLDFGSKVKNAPNNVWVMPCMIIGTTADGKRGCWVYEAIIAPNKFISSVRLLRFTQIEDEPPDTSPHPERDLERDGPLTLNPEEEAIHEHIFSALGLADEHLIWRDEGPFSVTTVPLVTLNKNTLNETFLSDQYIAPEILDSPDFWRGHMMIVRYGGQPVSLVMRRKGDPARSISLVGYYESLNRNIAQEVEIAARLVITALVKSSDALEEQRLISNDPHMNYIYAGFNTSDELVYLLGMEPHRFYDHYVANGAWPLPARVAPMSFRMDPSDMSIHKIPVLPGVFHGTHRGCFFSAKATEALADRGKKVLVIGTGVGLEAAIAAQKGADVTAVDIKQMAAENTKLTHRTFGSQGTVNSFYNDLFNDLGAYDLIVFAMPYFAEGNTDGVSQVTPFEMDGTDRGGVLLHKFLSGLAEHMRQGAKVVMINSNSEAVREILDSYEEFTYAVDPELEEGYSRTYIISKRETSLSTPEAKGALIGKYLVESVDEDDNLRDTGEGDLLVYAMDTVTHQFVSLWLPARRAPPAIFNQFRPTGLDNIDRELQGFLDDFTGSAYLLKPNEFGIDGIGLPDTLAILEPLQHNDIALFHEVAHAADIDVEVYIAGGRDALDGYIYHRHIYHRREPRMRQHYALRLFQKQQWEADDKRLTRIIKNLALLQKYGVYNSAQLSRLNQLYRRYVHSGLEALSKYEIVELRAYLILLGLGKTVQGRRVKERTQEIRKRQNGDTLHEVDDLYIGYEWSSSGVSIDQKKVLVRKAGIARLRPDSLVYSIGCGRGRDLMSLAEEWPYLQFVGIEADPASIAAAIVLLEKREKQGRPLNNIEFHLADCRPAIPGVPHRGIDADDGTVDMVLVIEDIMEDDDYQTKWMDEVWTEIVRVTTKPLSRSLVGGKIVFTGRRGWDAFKRVIERTSYLAYKSIFSDSSFERSPWQSDEVTALYRPEFIEAHVAQLVVPEERIELQPSPRQAAPPQEGPVQLDLPFGTSPTSGGTEPDFLRDIREQDQLIESLQDSIFSMLLSPKYSKEKLVLAFSRKLGGGEQHRTLIQQLKRWKLRKIRQNAHWANILKNLEIIEFNSRGELLGELRQLNIAVDENRVLTDKESAAIFTFAPMTESGDLLNLGEAVRPVYIDQRDIFLLEFYYPLIEIVTISLVKELMSYSDDDIFRVLSSVGIDRTMLANTLNIAAITSEPQTAFLVFTLIPRSKVYDHDDRVSRYARLRQFLESA